MNKGTEISGKIIEFSKVAFIYIFAWVIFYSSWYLLSWTGVAEFFSVREMIWRFYPHLGLPYVLCTLAGFGIFPVLWERFVWSSGFKELGFFLPANCLRETISGFCFLSFLVLYGLFLLPGKGLDWNFSISLFISFSVRLFFISLGEEILYRGVVQRRLAGLLGKAWGVVGTSLLFAFAGHFGEPIIDNLAWRLPGGLILGYFYVRSGSLFIPVLMHWFMNLVFAG